MEGWQHGINPGIPHRLHMLSLPSCSWVVLKGCLAIRAEQGTFRPSDMQHESLISSSQWNKITGGDAAETGSGPGSYDIRKTVWHVNVSFFSGIPGGARLEPRLVLTVFLVLQSSTRWWRRMGHLQRSIRLAKYRDLWLSHIIQPLLGRHHLHLPRNALQ